MENGTDGWRLGKRQLTPVGEVAYEVFGEGPPVVLVHGTPVRSYLWRNIVPALAESHSVYAYDLLGYGESEKGEGQDVSIPVQARLLGELAEAWGLDAPAIAGHDIGGGIVLRAHLLEGVGFSSIAVLDAVVLTPWLSEPRSSTWHVREYAEAYEAMPDHLFGAFFSAYLGETNSNLGEEAFEAYLAPWLGEGAGEPSSGRPSSSRSGTPERSSPGSALSRSPCSWRGVRRMGGSTPRRLPGCGRKSRARSSSSSRRPGTSSKRTPQRRSRRSWPASFPGTESGREITCAGVGGRGRFRLV